MLGFASPRGVDGTGLQNNLAPTETPENEATPLASPHLTEPSTTRLGEVSSHRTHWWREMDSNYRFRARMGTLLSARTLRIYLNYSHSVEGSRLWEGLKVRIHLPPAASHANQALRMYNE